MGVTTAPTRSATTQAVRRWAHSSTALRRLALASVIANVGIVVTGGAVRLTNSGLGCPSWPRCSGTELVPNARLGIHGTVEFTNRSLTFVVAFTAAMTLIAAWRQRREVRLAALAFAGVPAQAALGGIVVLTDLNPWLVALHFLLSAAIIAVTFAMWTRLRGRAPAVVPTSAHWLVLGLVAVAGAVLAAGTIVTGAGPHAGDVTAGALHRIHLPITGLAQLHADLVMVLVGLTVGVLAIARLLDAPMLRRASAILLGTELAQAGIGYTQYFLHVPVLLVGLHMLGACVVWLAVLNTAAASPSAPRSPHTGLTRAADG